MTRVHTVVSKAQRVQVLDCGLKRSHEGILVNLPYGVLQKGLQVMGMLVEDQRRDAPPPNATACPAVSVTP
jgi:hypothetical protein